MQRRKISHRMGSMHAPVLLMLGGIECAIMLPLLAYAGHCTKAVHAHDRGLTNAPMSAVTNFVGHHPLLDIAATGVAGLCGTLGICYIGAVLMLKYLDLQRKFTKPQPRQLPPTRRVYRPLTFGNTFSARATDDFPDFD